MTIPYRTRQTLKRILLITLVVLLAVVLIWGCWILWLGRFVVYTRDGAVLDFDRPVQFQDGEPAEPPVQPDVPPIYYNEGNDAINTSTELTQMMGYYADTDALADIPTVRSQMQALPAGTPVMVDVKNIYGSFFYSSALSAKRSSSVDTEQMDNLIQYLKGSNLYTIARVPALRDYEFGLNHVPDGLPTSGGYLWMDDDGCYWLNPLSQGTVAFLAQIAAELKDLGFDEVVFSDYYFPETESIVFNHDKTQALTDTAKTLVTTCSTSSFAVSFLGNQPFTLPDGRCRLYLDGVDAADAANRAEQTGIADTAIHLVFVTDVHDTRFDVFSVMRPLNAAH